MTAVPIGCLTCFCMTPRGFFLLNDALSPSSHHFIPTTSSCTFPATRLFNNIIHHHDISQRHVHQAHLSRAPFFLFRIVFSLVSRHALKVGTDQPFHAGKFRKKKLLILWAWRYTGFVEYTLGSCYLLASGFSCPLLC